MLDVYKYSFSFISENYNYNYQKIFQIIHSLYIIISLTNFFYYTEMLYQNILAL